MAGVLILGLGVLDWIARSLSGLATSAREPRPGSDVIPLARPVSSRSVSARSESQAALRLIACALVLLPLVAVIAGCSEDAAQPTRSEDPQRVWAAEPGSRALFPRLAQDTGVAVLAWTEADDEGPRAAWAAIRPIGAGWRAPERLPTDGAATVFDAAVDSRGAAMVAVVEAAGRLGALLRVFTRPPDAGWSASEPLAVSVGPGGLGGVDLAAGPDGEVVVVFERAVGGGESVVAVARTPDGRWGSPSALERPVPAREGGSPPSAAVGPGGRAIAVWERDGILAAERGDDGRWGPARRIGAGPSGFFPQVGIAPDGRTVVVWGATDPETVAQVVRVAERPRGGAWGAEETVYAPGGRGGGWPQTAMGPAGHIVVAFGVDVDRRRTIHAVLREPAGPFPPAEPLSRPLRLTPPPVTPAVAVDAEGNAAVAWAAGGPLTLGTRTPERGWSALRRFGDGAGMPALAAAEGRVLAAWVRGGGEVWVADVTAGE